MFEREGGREGRREGGSLTCQGNRKRREESVSPDSERKEGKGCLGNKKWVWCGYH